MLKRSEQYRREAEEDGDLNDGDKHTRVSSVLKELARLGRGLGAAAADSAKASDVESDRVRLQRVVSLLARWRECVAQDTRSETRSMNEGQKELGYYHRGRADALRDVIRMTEEEWAGKKANDEAERLAGGNL